MGLGLQVLNERANVNYARKQCMDAHNRPESLKYVVDCISRICIWLRFKKMTNIFGLIFVLFQRRLHNDEFYSWPRIWSGSQHKFFQAK